MVEAEDLCQGILLSCQIFENTEIQLIFIGFIAYKQEIDRLACQLLLLRTTLFGTVLILL